MEDITEEKAMEFGRCVYSGTTYSHKMKFVAFNNIGVLMQKPPSTEYINRISGSVYSESIWVFASYDADKRKLSCNPNESSLFFKEGKLLAEEKKMLKEKYGLEIPKKERIKKLTEILWAVVTPQDWARWGNYYEHELFMYRIVKDNKDSYVFENNKGEQFQRSKNKFIVRKYEDSQLALNDYLKLQRLAKEYKVIKEELSKKSKEISAVQSQLK